MCTYQNTRHSHQVDSAMKQISVLYFRRFLKTGIERPKVRHALLCENEGGKNPFILPFARFQQVLKIAGTDGTLNLNDHFGLYTTFLDEKRANAKSQVHLILSFGKNNFPKT